MKINTTKIPDHKFYKVENRRGCLEPLLCQVCLPTKPSNEKRGEDMTRKRILLQTELCPFPSISHIMQGLCSSISM